MIVRPCQSGEPGGSAVAIGISQPAHSRLAGELARHWIVPEELRAVPWTDLVLGAELHDIGYIEEELQPTWNPATGLPYSFNELPADLYLKMWHLAVEKTSVFSAYAQLVVAMHVGYLASFSAQGPGEEAEQVRQFHERIREIEAGLMRFLAGRSELAPALTPSILQQQQQLVADWDAMSLAMCGARSLPRDKPLRMELAASRENQRTVVLDPWPLAVPEFTWRAEARLFSRRYESQDDLDASFPQAERVPFDVVLQPKSDESF